MGETKYGKYIISELKKPQLNAAWMPKYRPEDKTELLYMDGDTFKDSFYAECCWFWPAMVENPSLDRSSKPHKHDYHELIGVIGTNPDDPYDLCGEIEMWLGGERHILTKSSFIFLPAGLEHGPFRELKMERPIFQFECAMTKYHT